MTQKNCATCNYLGIEQDGYGGAWLVCDKRVFVPSERPFGFNEEAKQIATAAEDCPKYDSTLEE